MISAFTVPHLNQPELLGRMLGSIDVPVERLVIIDNATRRIDNAWRALVELDETPCVEHLRVIEPGWNIGVAASWNLGMKVTPDAPWWCIANNDVAFAPGDLARLADLMNSATGPVVGMLVAFGAFALNAAALDAVGWFDENYHPAFCEDADWRWRAGLAGVPLVRLAAGATHVGSACLSDRGPDNSRTYPENVAYHVAKWGGPPWSEHFTTPYGAGGDLNAWTLDRRRLAAQSWR